ncbi:hypothetical protein DXG01_008929 [Tephrocybe rancida]|nr:hypothetical protein DXG01_008929 [Tephrocybe rancida]
MNTWAAAFASTDKPEGDQRHLLNQFSAAAIETTSSILQTFVLACIRYPQWISTAQKEIDTLVGPDRLPSFKDRPHLPYVEAIVRDYSMAPRRHVQRLTSLGRGLTVELVARYGVPHQSTADDIIEYRGQEYFIPKGSIIFAVAWAIEHDEARFKLPDHFMPERFLDAEGKLKLDYETSAFGFGRRVCPGIPFAERSLWINIATILWTFNIRNDPAYIYDDSDAAFSGDVTNSPLKFPAIFEPRSVQRAEVARREWAECEKDLSVLLPASKDVY